MKKPWLLIVLMVTSGTLQAQMNGLDLLKKYRIPETRYGFGTLAFSSNLNGNYYNTETPVEERESMSQYENYNFSIQPEYEYVYDSDPLQWDVFGYFEFELSGQENSYQNKSPFYTDKKVSSESYRWTKTPTLYGRASYRTYLSDEAPWSFYTYVSGYQWVSHYLRRDWEDPDTGKRFKSNQEYTRDYSQSTNVDILFSYGRIRNVTPVINAIRFGERLQKSGAITSPLNDETVSNLSAIFARIPYYTSFYERPEKLIRQDVEDALAQTDGYGKASSFQTEYAFESLSEMRFIRQEGWLVEAGFGHRYNKTDYDEYNSWGHYTDRTEESVVAVVLKASVFESLTLNSGFFLNAGFSGGPQISTLSSLKQQYASQIKAGLFYEWFDRLLVSGSHEITYVHRNVEAGRPTYFWNHHLTASGNYFLEDQVALTLSGYYQFFIGSQPGPYDNLWRQRNGEYSLSAGLTWYFGSTEAVGLRPWDATELNP